MIEVIVNKSIECGNSKLGSNDYNGELKMTALPQRFAWNKKGIVMGVYGLWSTAEPSQNRRERSLMSWEGNKSIGKPRSQWIARPMGCQINWSLGAWVPLANGGAALYKCISAEPTKAKALATTSIKIQKTACHSHALLPAYSEALPPPHHSTQNVQPIPKSGRQATLRTKRN